MKRLKQVLPSHISVKITGDTNIEIKGIELDSRKIEDGYVFVAIKGLAMDGHDFIDKAIDNGAVAIVVQNEYSVNENITKIQVADSRQFLAEMATSFYDHPSRDLKLIGITGTNGKTTTATMLYDIYQKLGYKVGLISTIENRIHHEVVTAERTTPDAASLNRLLADMVDAQCDYVFMEVSSHAIDQKRTACQHFSGGIFTNISRDHLGYHNSFKEYIDVKKKFFDLLDDNAYALVNVDDKHGNLMVQNTKATTHRYSLRTLVNYKTKVLANSLEGLHLSINTSEVFAMFTGTFNAYNITAAFAAADIMGEDTHELLRAISAIRPAEGRFDVMIGRRKKVYGVIDYAHTPDALENVLTSIRQIMNAGSLITVVGCGGNRDKGKRPQMASIACQYSDTVLLTSDNPRDEDPLDILNDMENGINEDEADKVLIIEDRKQAIKTAIKMARENDVVLIAGKGHEKYQEIKGKKIPFDDKLILKAFLL